VPEFAEPARLALLALVPIAILIRLRSGVAESRFKRVAGSVLRCLALAAIAIALAGPLIGASSTNR